MKRIPAIVLALVLMGIIFGIYYYAASRKISAISDFEECAAAGYPIGESYPRQCWTPDGRNFVENISQ